MPKSMFLIGLRAHSHPGPIPERIPKPKRYSTVTFVIVAGPSFIAAR